MQVSKEEYELCRLAPQQQARVVAVCDQQAGKARAPPFTVTFRSFTPQPNGLEFKPGQDYYFITALIGHHNEPHKRFAPCREQNMKVIFKVCCKSPNSVAASAAAAASASASSGQQRQGGVTQRPVGVSSTRRPSVITYRPSVAPIVHSTAQPQPITVLPIEVLQSGNNAGEPGVVAAQAQTDSTADNERNDIVQNEQPSSTLQPPAQADNSGGGLSALLNKAGRAPAPALFPFDPTAPPDVIRSYDRYAPTPLPTNLKQQQQQPMGRLQTSRNLPALEPAESSPWQVPSPRAHQQPSSMQQQQQQIQLHQQQNQPQSKSRNVFYPAWPTCKYCSVRKHTHTQTN